MRRSTTTWETSTKVTPITRLGRSVLILALLALVAAACGGEGDTASPSRGAELYEASCQTCHGDPVTGEGRIPAETPSHGPGGHTWHHADGQLIDLVLGRFNYPGREMPSFGDTLSDQDVEDILAYLKQGWTAEQRDYQAEVSRLSSGG